MLNMLLKILLMKKITIYNIINTPGPAGNSSECNSGDNSETYTSGSVTYVNTTECELK